MGKDASDGASGHDAPESVSRRNFVFPESIFFIQGLYCVKSTMGFCAGVFSI